MPVVPNLRIVIDAARFAISAASTGVAPARSESTIAAVATPAFFDQPTEDGRQTVRAMADQIVAALGRDEAEYLLFYLGPKDGTFASFEPLSMKIENKIRDLVTLHAFDQWCNCAMYWGCSDWRYYCSTSTYCQEPSGYPLCGWLFMDRCDGGCA